MDDYVEQRRAYLEDPRVYSGNYTRALRKRWLATPPPRSEVWALRIAWCMPALLILSALLWLGLGHKHGF